MTKQETRKKLFDILHDERLSWTPDSVDALQMAIDALESAQPEHKKGKWIPVTYRYVIQDGEFPKTTIKWQDATEPDDVEGMKCSECGTIYDFTEARNWCSECGADMRGKQDETD